MVDIIIVNGKGREEPFSRDHIVGHLVLRGITVEKSMKTAKHVEELICKIGISRVSTDGIRYLVDEILGSETLINLPSTEELKDILATPIPRHDPEKIPQKEPQNITEMMARELSVPGKDPHGYDPELVDIYSATRTADGSVRLVYGLPVENQFWHPGIRIKRTDTYVTLEFLRAHFTESPEKFGAITTPDSTNVFNVYSVLLETIDSSSVDISWEGSSKKIEIADSSESAEAGAKTPEPPKTSIAPVTGSTVTTPPSAPATTPPPCPFILIIHSNCAEDQGKPPPGLTAGHAWLTLHDGKGKLIASYGLWPDSHPGIVAAGLNNGAGSDVRVNFRGDLRKGKYFFWKCITKAQRAVLNAAISRLWTWTFTNTCASFASEVFYEVTQIDIDADEFMGFETPREIGESILEANGGNPRPIAASPAATGNPPPASSGW